VTVELPSGSALDISVRDGLLTGQGRLGVVRAHLSQGDIHLDYTGELRLSTDDGDITVATCGGRPTSPPATARSRSARLSAPQ
jgi:hypothetical protein